MNELFFTAKFNAIMADQQGPINGSYRPSSQEVINDLLVQNPRLELLRRWAHLQALASSLARKLAQTCTSK
ncbi:hypothetical protein K435DRAFT_881669 [Dendrothele bispora CBS 962.96]|uniref:Uncharacterized protein n=1 Tax=Dendrothele bispora (strain CBS 962.96) TaxID=1314807 RepID=A0A4S8KI69_DENBC|nr:hypothetical protein K435DRAFT_881669 [Dendrothele bispora CBS 962.96]